VLERNALRSMIKNLDDQNLERLLGPTLLLLIERVRLASGSRRADFEFGAPPRAWSEKVDRHALAPLHAVGAVVADLEGLIEERRRVQQKRRRSDAEIFQLFGRPFTPLGATGEEYFDSSAKVTQGFRLDRVFERRRASRVLILAYDVVGERMAGPAIRSWEIAHALARFAPVTLAFWEKIQRKSPSVELAVFHNQAELEALVHEADIVFHQGFSMEGSPFLRSTRCLRVVDLYDPWIFEDLESHRLAARHETNHRLRLDVDVQRRLLRSGDYFICASERQRDYWLGMLTAVGRIDRSVYDQDPTLRSLIDVVPYGCPDEPPRATTSLLRGVHPSIGEDAFIILWSGGTWEWFDPMLVLEAFQVVLARERRARLVFMGLELEGRGLPPQKAAADVLHRAQRLGLLGREVVVYDWVPYDSRAECLLEADVAVMATRDFAESRLAFRSRALDHFWAGLPTVATEGDALSELIEAEQAGLVVPPGDVTAMADALLRLIRDDDARQAMGQQALALADRFRWSKVVEPLRQLIEEPWRWHALRSSRAAPVAMTEDAQRLLAAWRQPPTLPAVARQGLRASPTARAVWHHLPDPIKRTVRPAIERALR
jgi:glycosyltransferase involved in cell wall biosynthesis